MIVEENMGMVQNATIRQRIDAPSPGFKAHQRQVAGPNGESFNGREANDRPKPMISRHRFCNSRPPQATLVRRSPVRLHNVSWVSRAGVIFVEENGDGPDRHRLARALPAIFRRASDWQLAEDGDRAPVAQWTERRASNL